MRVGTWNLEGRWSQAHLELMVAQACDVWLLTEVRDDVSIPRFRSHLTAGRMSTAKSWAAVLSRAPIQPLPDPHPASAAATTLGVSWCSSILPWRSCGSSPWGPGTTAERTARAVKQLTTALPTGDLVWGGDWNHAMRGREYVGSGVGRIAIDEALDARGLYLATRYSPHRLDGLGSIDHVAVPSSAQIASTNRIVAEDRDGKRLSDHDAYTVTFTCVATTMQGARDDRAWHRPGGENQ